MLVFVFCSKSKNLKFRILFQKYLFLFIEHIILGVIVRVKFNIEK